MNPTDIDIFWPTPLTDCFGKTEAELAAALMLLALQRRKDDSGLRWVEMSEFRESVKQVPKNIRNCPFVYPDVYHLERFGYVELDFDKGVKRLRFTELGLRRLASPGEWMGDPLVVNRDLRTGKLREC